MFKSLLLLYFTIFKAEFKLWRNFSGNGLEAKSCWWITQCVVTIAGFLFLSIYCTFAICAKSNEFIPIDVEFLSISVIYRFSFSSYTSFSEFSSLSSFSVDYNHISRFHCSIIVLIIFWRNDRKKRKNWKQLYFGLNIETF